MQTDTVITLRPFKSSDNSALVKILNNAEVTRYITSAITSPYSQHDADDWLSFSANNKLVNAIIYQDQLIGCISAQPRQFEYSHSAELGYWLAQPYWGQGIMTNAVKEFIKQLQTDTQLSRFTVSVVTENIASIRVLEKNGFVREGTMKCASYKDEKFFDEYLYAFTQ